MSPTIFMDPDSLPRKSSDGSVAGTSFATGRPIFVITTGSRVDCTSSITLRQRALNSPAGMVFMTSPDDYGHSIMTIRRPERIGRCMPGGLLLRARCLAVPGEDECGHVIVGGSGTHELLNLIEDGKTEFLGAHRRGTL